MKNVLFLLCIFFLGSSHLSGQVDSTQNKVVDVEYEYYYPMEFHKYAIGISPSSFFNYYSGVQISQDFGLKPKINLTLETAYIFSSIYQVPIQGFRLKPGIQFMLVSSDYVGFAIGASYNYRHTKSRREYVLNIWEEQYREVVQFDRLKQFSAGELNFSLIAKASSKVRLEFGFGIGSGQLTVTDSNATNDAAEQDNFQLFEVSLYDEPGKTVMLLGSFNINIQYAIVTR